MVFKILLVHPSAFMDHGKSSIEELHAVTAPLGLAYLAAMVKDLDTEVKILDANLLQLGFEEIGERIQEFKPNMVGIGVTSASAKSGGMIADIVKKLDPRIMTVVGGPHIIATGTEMLEVFKGIDIIIPGDAEEAFKELVQNVIAKKPLAKSRGIIFRRKSSFIRTEAMPLLPLDELPFPDWDLLPPLDKYSFQPASYRRKPHSFVVASRGCPYRCVFCHISRFRHQIRFRSPKNIVEEIKVLYKKHGMREFRFGDEIFTLNKKWCMEICDRIIASGLDITWTCDTRPDHMSLELAKKLKEAGCWSVSIGVESGSQRILDRIKKDITLQQVLDTVSYAHQAGLVIRAFFMLGFPFETREDLEKTISFAKRSGIDFVQFSYVIPFPGTEIYDICQKRGVYGKYGWMDYDSSVYTTPVCLPGGIEAKEMQTYFKRAYREFYFRPSLWLKTLASIRSLTAVKRYAKGFLGLLRM